MLSVWLAPLMSVCVCVWLLHVYVHRFGGSVGHDTHILYTLSALQILALVDRLDLVSDKHKVAEYVASLQQSDGSFAGDKWGEYC